MGGGCDGQYALRINAMRAFADLCGRLRCIYRKLFSLPLDYEGCLAFIPFTNITFERQALAEFSALCS